MTKVWSKLASILSGNKVTKRTGKKLYPNGVTGSTIKKWVYNILYGFCSYHESADYHSGSDNEPSDQ